MLTAIAAIQNGPFHRHLFAENHGFEEFFGLARDL